MTLLDGLFLIVAGLLSGFIGSTAGLASLVSYPALLAIGMPPITANVTNTVALVATGAGTFLGSRPELSGRGPWMRRYGGLAILGGATGAGLLLLTPESTFEQIVPFFIAGASVLLLLQPRIRNVHRERLDAGSRWSLPLGIFVVTIYGGYFGAAAGVMLVALLLVLTDETLAVNNAAKSMLLWMANLVAAIAFVVLTPVQWAAVIPLAMGSLAGGALGPAFTRRVSADLMRWGVALAGFAVAVRLWFAAGG